MTRDEWAKWVSQQSVLKQGDRIITALYELEQRAEKADEEWNIAQTEMDNMVRANQRTVIRMRALEKVAKSAAEFCDNHFLNYNGDCNLHARGILQDVLDKLDALEKTK